MVWGNLELRITNLTASGGFFIVSENSPYSRNLFSDMSPPCGITPSGVRVMCRKNFEWRKKEVGGIRYVG